MGKEKCSGMNYHQLPFVSHNGEQLYMYIEPAWQSRTNTCATFGQRGAARGRGGVLDVRDSHQKANGLQSMR
eukprot:2117509-Amphidinium_carterae.2